MPRLEEIPTSGQLTPDEVEALANDTFDYADRERVSMREARRKIQDDAIDDNRRANLREINRIFGTEFETRDPNPPVSEIREGYGNFTFKEKAAELAKGFHRGLGSIVKLPGVALKAIGELEPTRAEIASRPQGDMYNPRGEAYFNTTIGRAERVTMNALRKAGNAYIAKVQSMTMRESPESMAVRNRPFASAPFYRTGAAVAESVPSYGMAIAATLSSGNPNVGLWVLGSTTASTSYDNLRAQGVDPDLALIGAVAEGSIEMLTEKVPMDMLMRGAGRPLLVRALKIGTAESFQELFAQLGQNYVNAVITDIDPENRASAIKAAHQEWSIISQGWQDAMAAGFVMGGGAAAITSGPSPELGRTAEEMQGEYGFIPRNTNEWVALTDKIKENVRNVGPFEGVVEAAAEAGDTAEGRVASNLAELQAEADAKAKIAAGEPLEDAERERFPELATQEDQIRKLTPKTGIAGIQQATPEAIAEAGLPPSSIPTLGPEIGEGERKPRGTSLKIIEKAIEDELLAVYKDLEVPTYKSMTMADQADKSLALIEQDIEKAKRIAFYQEEPGPDLYPENVFTALRIYAKMTGNVDLLMDLALNENTVTQHTILGKRIKSLDTGEDSANPVRAIREVVDARKENMARKGQDVVALEAELNTVRAELDATKKAVDTHIQKTKREYGTRNTIVTRTEYDSIIARRKAEAADLKHDPRLGAVYVPTPGDFADIAKIGMFHLEAMGRDFAKWSYQMTRDFGEWITPHLQDEYDKVLAQAATQGLEIKESKRLTAKKKRLATGMKKIEGKLTEQDLAKVPRLQIELDPEGQRLQNEYDAAREKFKAAQAAANIITEEEVRIIGELSKNVAETKNKMESMPRRKQGKLTGTKGERAYGTALSLFNEYVGALKGRANKKTVLQNIKAYLKNPVDFVSDVFGTMLAAKASLDNSFIGKQGRRTFLKGITLDLKSMRIWTDTLKKSFEFMWHTGRGENAMRVIFADIVSDPDYPLLKQAKIAVNVIEEEIPVDIPSRLPVIGIAFKMGENAFVGSARYMRYALAKQYIEIWRKSKVPLTKQQLVSLGNLANSQTGRGFLPGSGRPGIVNAVFFSPRNIKADIDTLTLHLFDRNFTARARLQAAENLLRYISGAAMILAIADWIDDDSVTWDATSADFGKIKIGDSRFSVGGGMEIVVILAARLYARKVTSSTTGKVTSIDTRRFGARTGKDLIFNFLENKLSPGAAMALSLAEGVNREGNKITIPQMINDGLTPLIIESAMESANQEDAANILAIMIAEAFGVFVQTYSSEPEKSKSKRRTNL